MCYVSLVSLAISFTESSTVLAPTHEGDKKPGLRNCRVNQPSGDNYEPPGQTRSLFFGILSFTKIPTSCTMKIQVVSLFLAIGGANARAVRC
jgi:hypothetical protein